MTAREPMRGVWRDRAGRQPDREAWTDDDRVVLVDDEGAATGAAHKSAVHHDDTPLHLAFSCYVFDPDGRLLLTTRAPDKPSFPGVLTNSVCGHPRPGEPVDLAATRRAHSELGLAVGAPRLLLPRFAYRAVMDGVVEHEICPVFAAWVEADTEPSLDPTEVGSARWVPWTSFRDEVLSGALAVSPWCAEQVRALADLPDDPASWPAADPALLPPAAHLSAGAR